ncbi:MAG: hypothetical protein ACTHMB_06970, partial [Candidatus Binatia bacterium]
PSSRSFSACNAMKIVLRWLLAYRRWHNVLCIGALYYSPLLPEKVPSFSNFGFGFVGRDKFSRKRSSSLLSILSVTRYKSVKINSGQHRVVFKSGSGFDLLGWFV